MKKYLKKKAAEEVTLIFLPHLRQYMHLDTVFTLIKSNESVVYEPLICTSGKAKVRHFAGSIESYSDFKSLKELLVEKYKSWNFILCGEGKAPFAEREQWTDGCNVFTVREGVAFAYERNTKTNNTLKASGYDIVQGEYLLAGIKAGKINPSLLKNTVITLPSAELSRARGGPHCMTMPLMREV